MGQSDKVKEYAEDLEDKKFYGETVIKWEHGKIVIIKETKSIKLSD